MFLNYLLLPIYIDYSSTSPVDPRIIEKMLPYFYYKFGNYSSRSHIFGWQVEYSIENSRYNASMFLNCDSRELIWTSGATESNNFSIKNISLFYKSRGNHIITLRTEHKSILDCFSYLIDNGFNITFLNVGINGLLNFNFLKSCIKKDTIFISVMFVNNEIGVIQDIKRISIFCKKRGILFHVDAAQAVGKLFINLNFLQVDLMSISCHKIYGPKGVGLLYIRRKSNLYLGVLFHGGGQEKGLRSGTLPTPQLIGLGEVFKILKKEFFFENLKIKNYKNIIFIELLKIDSIYLNGDLKYRIPHNLNVSFDFVEGESIILSMKNIALSTGSACASKSLTPSYVLKSLNKFHTIIHSSIRFSLGKFNRLSDIYYLLKLLFFNINNLRFLSPLIDTHKNVL